MTSATNELFAEKLGLTKLNEGINVTWSGNLRAPTLDRGLSEQGGRAVPARLLLTWQN